MSLILATLLTLVGMARAGDTYTPNLGLVQPALNSTNWGGKINADFGIIDSSAAIKMDVAASTTTLKNRVDDLYNVKLSSGVPVPNILIDKSTSAQIGSCSLPNVVTALNTGAGPTCQQPSNVTGNAATATAAQLAPSAANSGYLCRGVDASWNCLTAFVDATEVSGSTNPVTSGRMFTALAGKQPTGNYITALIGDVAAAGPGSATAVLATTQGNVRAFSPPITFVSSVTVTSNLGIIGSGTFTSTTTVNGLQFFGIMTGATLRTIACPSAVLGTCLAVNSDEGDIYLSTGSAISQWRNGRTGKGP